MSILSPYSDVFTQGLKTRELIKHLPLDTANLSVQLSGQELNVDDTIDAAFFLMGKQQFLKKIEHITGSRRFILGDERLSNGSPSKFTVGMALICLYAANYNAVTRTDIKETIYSFLHNGGTLRLKNASLDTYVDLLQMQTLFKLPPQSLTGLLANEQELEEKLTHAEMLNELKENQLVLSVQQTADNSIKVAKKYEAIINPRQYSLLDDDLNQHISDIHNGNHNENLENIEDITQANIGDNNQSTTSQYPDILAQALQQFKAKQEQAQEHDLTQEEQELNQDEENEIIIETAATNQVAVEHEFQPTLQLLSQSKTFNDTSGSLIERQHALLDMLEVAGKHVSTEEGMLVFAKITDKLLTTNNNFDLNGTIQSLIVDNEDETVKQKLSDLNSALNWKHHAEDKSTPKFEDFMAQPYLSYFNVAIDNNRLNLMAIRPLKDNKKLEQFYRQYASNGALQEYIAKDVANTDYDNSFSAKLTSSGQTGMVHLAKIANFVNDEQTIVKIIDKMFNADLNDLVTSEELTRLLTVSNSMHQVEINGNMYPAYQVFQDNLLEQLPDILATQQFSNGKVVELMTMLAQGASLNINTKEQGEALGNLFRNMQHAAFNNIIPQEFVDEVYQNALGQLNGHQLARVLTKNEIEHYEIALDKQQEREFNQTLKNEADAEKRRLREESKNKKSMKM